LAKKALFEVTAAGRDVAPSSRTPNDWSGNRSSPRELSGMRTEAAVLLGVNAASPASTRPRSIGARPPSGVVPRSGSELSTTPRLPEPSRMTAVFSFT
jgi:hypothetical protein